MRRGANRPAIGRVEVCTPQASHDPGKLLKGLKVGQCETPISVLLLADDEVQCVSVE